MKQPIKGLFFLFALTCFSCQPDYYYEHQFDIADQQWTYKDTVDFELEILDTTRIYNLYLDLQHGLSYPHQNMYVLIHTTFPTGVRKTQQVSLEMADKTGNWFGKCSSEYCDLRIDLQKGAFFNLPGQYVFTLEQYMRLDPLPGVKSIALRVEETDQNR